MQNSMGNSHENRVDFFDGLRGWASIAVLFVHIGAALYGWPHFQDRFLQNNFGKIVYLLFDGPFAVYIFFVLSGFALSLSYMKNKSLCCLTGLVIRRIPRLGIPVFFSTIAIFFLINAGCMHNQDASIITNELNTWFNQFYNFVPSVKDMVKSIPGVFVTGNAKYNGVLWTMRYEFLGSYYIVIFLLAIHYSAFYKKMFVWVVSTILSLYVLPSIACFNFGLLIAFIYIDKKELILKLQGNKLGKIMILIIIGICYGLKLFSDQHGSRFSAVLSVIAAFFIVLSITFISTFQWFFSNKVSRFLGKISFPLYIVHLPIICSCTALLMIKYNQYKENMMIIIIYSVSTLVSLIIACCFYPIEKLSIWFSKRASLFINADQGRK